MKKIFQIAAAALLAAGAFSSCDINDVLNYKEQSTENFPASEKDAIAVLAGIYQNLNAVNAYPQQSFHYYSLLASDDQLGGGGTNDKLMQAMDIIANYQANMTNEFFVMRYQGINRANTLLAALPNLTSLTEEQKVQFMGEAKFLRAFYHYELASFYGNVPLMTEPTGETVVQGDVKVLWGQILQDLYEASTTMAKKRLSDGHIDRYTAQAMLGRAWLFYTGFYCNGTSVSDLVSTNYAPLTEVALPNGQTLTKAQVIACIDECVNESGYDLVSDYRNLWAYTNKYTVEDYPYTAGKGLKWVEDDNDGVPSTNIESMFAIKFNKMADWQTTIGYANGYSLHFGMRGGQAYANTFPFGQGWGAGPVAPNLVNDWKSVDPAGNDIRREASVANVNDLPAYTRGGWADFVQETDYYGKKLSPISAKKEDGSYTCCFENLMYGTDGWLQDSENMQLNNIHDLVLIRFADVLLMQSELKEDVSGINRVRQRAGLSTIGSYSLQALQDERRWELAFEGTRWNDIRRWHIAAAALEKQTNQPVYFCGTAETNSAHNGGYTARYNATAGFMKMPDDQVAMGIVVQNEGWTEASSEYSGW